MVAEEHYGQLALAPAIPTFGRGVVFSALSP